MCLETGPLAHAEVLVSRRQPSVSRSGRVTVQAARVDGLLLGMYNGMVLSFSTKVGRHMSRALAPLVMRWARLFVDASM